MSRLAAVALAGVLLLGWSGDATADDGNTGASAHGDIVSLWASGGGHHSAPASTGASHDYSGSDSMMTGFVWAGLPNECNTYNAGYCTPADPINLPQVTDADVVRAFRRIPLPAPRSKSQPADKTLVNFDTIFYVDTHSFRRVITLLGQRITLDINPAQFTWAWGDGTTATTDQPGAPYPDKDVVHRYPHIASIAHHVTITWTARYRVGGGPWRDVPGTATSTGPATDLRIVEAVPVLSGSY